MSTALSYFPSNSPVVATLQTGAGTSDQSLQSPLLCQEKVGICGFERVFNTEGPAAISAA
jgi:hypothetical protein